MTKNWWKTFFDEYYLTIWKARGKFAHTKKEVDFIEKIIPLKKNYKILDLWCGHGRHSLELARRGYQVTGLDYSEYEMALAKKEAQAQNLKINFIKGDARRLRFKKKFDVILNLFSSAFGYGSEKETKNIIKGISRALKKGGYFLLDTINTLYVLRNYKPKAIDKAGKLVWVAKRHFAPLTFRNYEDAVIKDRKGHILKHHHTSARLYIYPEIKSLFVAADLKPLKISGSLVGKRFTPDSKRLVVLVRKI